MRDTTMPPSDQLPIPPALWQRLQAFLKSGGTGRIVLDAHQGRVRSMEITERFKADDRT